MTVSQISVFTESKPGHLLKMLKIFQSAGVSVRGYSVSDTGEYGIARFIVDRPDAATDALRAANAAFTTTQVICIKLDDKPGELARIMEILAKCDVNVLYSYSLISTYIVISANDLDKVLEALSSEPVKTVSQKEISELGSL